MELRDDLVEALSAFPERIGRYQLVLPIGTGGMATVFLARTRVVGELFREVALKLLHPQFRIRSYGEELIEEARLAARIRHPNVVSVLEVEDSPFGVFLVMEYVEGDTLAGLIRAARKKKGTIPLPVAGRILSDALLGLDAAHELRDESGELLDVVHRDFSPQNILVGIDGIAKLTDFGIAKAASRLSMTATGVVKGKLGYMAPEQVLGKNIDRRCDIWSAGVVVWETLAGRRLFGPSDEMATAVRVASGARPPLITSVRPDVSPAFDRTILMALTEARTRVSSAAGLRRVLLDVWREVSEIADTAEVAEYVSQVSEPKLATLRQQIREALDLRVKMARVSKTAVALASGRRSEMTPETPPAPHSEDALRSSVDPEASLPPPAFVPPSEAQPNAEGHGVGARRFRLWGAVLVFGLVTLAGLLWWRSWAADEPEPRALQGISPKIAPSASVSTLSGEARASGRVDVAASAPSADKPVRTIIVRADAKIAQLTVGNRNVTVLDPSTEVELSSVPKVGGLTIRARSTDGRRATGTLEDGEAEVVVLFGGKATGWGWRGKSPSPRSSKQPGLAPPPYHRK